MRLSRLAAMAIAASALVAPVVHAQEATCGNGTRWISFVVAPAFDDAFAEAARAHLAAELAPRGIAVCGRRTSGDGAAPAARVAVDGDPDDTVTLRIDEDATHTTVERRLDFSGVPAAGRALAFGVAADELLTAHWAGLALGAETPAPAPVRADVVAVAAPAPVAADLRGAFATMGVGFSGVRFGDGPALVGPELIATLTRGRLASSLRAGTRAAPRVQSTHGEIAFSDLHGALVGEVSLLAPHRRARFGPLLAVEVARVSVRGEAQGGGSARDGSGVAVLARAGVGAAVPLGRLLRVGADFGVTRALRPVRARDAGATVAGVAGMALQATVVAEIVF